MAALAAERIRFGFLRGPDAAHFPPSPAKVDHSNVSLQLDLTRGRRELKIFFASTDGVSWGQYRIHLPLQYLGDLYQSYSNEQGFDLILTADTAPVVWYCPGRPHRSRQGAQQRWTRATEVPQRARLVSAPVSSTQQSGLNISSCRTYCLDFLRTSSTYLQWNHLREALRGNNVQIKVPGRMTVTDTEENSLWAWLDEPRQSESESDAEVGSARDWLNEMKSLHQPLDFSVRYMLEACISQGLLSEYAITPDDIKRLNNLPVRDAVRRLEAVADTARQLFDPQMLFTIPLSPSDRSRFPPFCTVLRSVTVTPSHVCVSPPAVEMSNRVIRQFAEHTDRFLRVRFADEKNEGKLWSRTNNTQTHIYQRIKQSLIHGLEVGGRHYEFVACGNSQFREHGAYFFAFNSVLTAKGIRDWLGDFSKITTVPKYIARMGQCFSTTRAVTSTRVQLQKLHDVERNGHVFTDGVGKISKFLAQMVAMELHLPYTPSVFQFRLGGCKGILAVAPDLEGRTVQIRESQYKFAAPHEGLEIIRCSSFSCADLNRQLISILTCLGVPNHVFLHKVRRQIADISEALTNQAKAICLLKRRVDQNQMTLQIASMIESGFITAQEPFVLSVLDLWRSWCLKRLKEKARVEIEEGAFVLGCTDETATLRGHGPDVLPEIFIQVPVAGTNSFQVIEGICIVARNPSLQEGDIRVVLAVDVPALHHLKDVVVFPQTGERDLPSMCSGGDLDGDDFFVSWDRQLLPPRSFWNRPPGEYAAPTPETKSNIIQADVADFYVDYIRNDNLGKIANSWQAIADHSELGALDARCVELAELHSKAVDFVKTGISAVMHPHLEPRVWPHFMVSKTRPLSKIYTSRTILGQLYDEVETRDYHPHLSNPFDSRVLMAGPVGQEHLDVAKEVKGEYDIAVRRIMAQHEIATEFEVFTAFCLAHNTLTSDYKFQVALGEASAALKDSFREICIQRAGGKKQLPVFVQAMYKVTADEVAALRDTPVTPRISFPWLFADILAQIASGSEHVVKQIPTEQRTAKTKDQKKEELLIDFSVDSIETAEGPIRQHELLELDFDFAAPRPQGSQLPLDTLDDDRDKVNDTVATEQKLCFSSGSSYSGHSETSDDFQAPEPVLCPVSVVHEKLAKGMVPVKENDGRRQVRSDDSRGQ